MNPRGLALFDLDHTLIPFDSGLAWTRHLIALGALPPETEERYLGYCHQYVAGTLDIRAMHRASMAPLAGLPLADLQRWRLDFQRAMASLLPAPALALVRRHREAGDLCAIVTATTRWVAEPFARLFEVPHLVCTEAVPDGERPGAEIDGLPCFREHKPTRVRAWLVGLGHAGLDDFADSWFYSDSVSDLPLLQAVSRPVAVCPDPRLRAHALASGWPVVDGHRGP